jgi:hypothetical protein
MLRSVAFVDSATKRPPASTTKNTSSRSAVDAAIVRRYADMLSNSTSTAWTPTRVPAPSSSGVTAELPMVTPFA